MKTGSFKDTLYYYTYLAGATTLAAGTIAMYQAPVISAAAIGMVLAFHKFGIPFVKDLFRDHLLELERHHDRRIMMRLNGAGYEEKVQQTLQDGRALAKKMGFETMPEFHFLPDNTDGFKTSVRQTTWKYLKDVFGPSAKGFKQSSKEAFFKYANAAAFAHKKNRVLYTESLIKQLTREELQYVTAHELVHLKERHNQKAQHIRQALGVASLTASLAWLTSVATQTGFGPLFLYSIATTAITAALYRSTRKVFGQKTLHKIEDKLVTKMIAPLSTIGIGYMAQNTDFMVAAAMVYGVNNAAELIKQGYSRINEFHADRGATEAVENTDAVLSALDKVRKYNLNFERGMHRNISVNPENHDFVTRAFIRAGELYATHPNITRRHRHVIANAKDKNFPWLERMRLT